jgi:Cytidylate kinase-like family
MTLITLSASYGAGGSHVGPELARRLGVPFVDRALPVAVADRLDVPVEAALKRDECLAPPLERWLARFVHSGGAITSAPVPAPVHGPDERSYVDACETAIREQAARGHGVILGRAAAVVLREDPRALHVRLDGPVGRRAARAAEHEGISLVEARTRLERTDRARETYVKRFYGVDPHDPALYHVMLDSTAIPLETCVEMILAASAGGLTPSTPRHR